MHKHKIDKILVPVNFTSCSDAAVDYALFLAEMLDATIDVLHVWEIPRFIRPGVQIHTSSESREELRDFAKRQAKIELDNFISKIEKSDGVQVGGLLRCGEVSTCLLAAIQAEDYDLVVIGTRGRTGITHFLLGSIAEKVVRAASCAVLTIRMAPAESEESPDA